ncbi:hypothetical protein IWW50_005494, partial [Coemansia erecta]
MFKSAQLKSLGSSKTPKKAADDEEFMASLMDDLEVPQTPSRSTKQKAQRDVGGSYSAKRRIVAARGRPAGPITPKPEPVHVVDISDPTLDPFAEPPPAKKARSDMDNPFIEASADAEEFKAEDIKPDIGALEGEMDVGDDALLDGLEELQDEAAAPEPALYGESQPQGQSWMDVQLEMAKHPALLRQESTASDAMD